MSTNHDAVAALPIGSSAADKTLMRNVLVQRMPYVLADTDNFANVVATDPNTGAKIVDVLYLGRVFHYDPTDTTTAADGTSCLVSNDGLRYKLAQGTDVFCYAVLDNTIATPPASPSVGDSYLVAAAATGAWAGKSGYVAVRTRRGWEFVNFGIGRLIYVESTDTFYHKNVAGNWIAGFGTQSIGANSVSLSAAINFGKRLIVENQTTTAPPGSPTVGTAYIIGAGATGAWAGQDGKVAICEVAGAFTIYQPSNGWAAYDKAQNNEFRHNGTSWVSAIGALLGHGGIVAFDDTVDMAKMARYAFEFCAIESCGKCTPCRIGSSRGVNVIDDLLAGREPERQRELLTQLCETMIQGSLCGLGGMAPFPVQSALKHFPEDFAPRGRH